MSSDAIITTLFWSAEAVFAVTAVVMCIAEFVLHRPVSLPVPSLYWPVAKLGFHRNRNVRRVFRFLFCDLYRKRFWNPVMNTSLKQKGFDRQRHRSTSNIHAACSAMVLTLIAFTIYCAMYIWAVGFAGFELIFNAPAIVLSRYLYLLTRRRPGLNRPRKTFESEYEKQA
jgi:hypothetical protein